MESIQGRCTLISASPIPRFTARGTSVLGDCAATSRSLARLRWTWLSLFSLFASFGTAFAAGVPVPNASFESPATQFVDTRIDAWAKAPKPVWYDESGGFLWDQLAGVFANVASTNSVPIDNADGNQGLYLFAVPQMAVFQDLATTNQSGATGSDVRFTPGTAYDLTVGVIGGGGGMLAGTTLQLSVYYQPPSGAPVPVATNEVTFTTNQFPVTTHFVDFTVHVPTVQATDPWAGQGIGIQFASTVRPELATGGYWDLDNVRLTALPGVPAPALSAARSGSHILLSVQAAAGGTYEVLASAQVTVPSSQWVSLGRLTNATGTVTFSDIATNQAVRFYQVRALP